MPGERRFSLAHLFVVVSLWAAALGLARQWYVSIQAESQPWGMLAIGIACIAIGGTVLNMRAGILAALFFVWVFVLAWLASDA